MAGQYIIYFSKGTIISFSIIKVYTLLGYITFYIIFINTPFLFCIRDIDKLGVKLNKFKDILI